MTVLKGSIHGITHFFMEDEKGIYFPDYHAKNKKWIWHPTLVCSQRRETFEVVQSLAPEEANAITQAEIDKKVGRL